MHGPQHVGAAAPGLAAPERPHNDEAPGVTAEGFKGQGREDRPDSHRSRHAEQAALTIEGEAYARAYLERLQRGTVSPDDLAVLMAFLQGEMLAGACRVIEKALRGGRHE